MVATGTIGSSGMDITNSGIMKNNTAGACALSIKFDSTSTASYCGATINNSGSILDGVIFGTTDVIEFTNTTTGVVCATKITGTYLNYALYRLQTNGGVLYNSGNIYGNIS